MKYSAALFLAATIVTQPMLSNAEEFPKVSGYLSTSLNNKWRYKTENDTERNNLYIYLEPSVTVNFTDKFLLKGTITLDFIKDKYPSKNKFFNGEDIVTKDIYLQYDNGTYGGQIGRITAGFGRAWWATPGLGATELAEWYAIWDKWGVKGWTVLDGQQFGKVNTTLSAFYLDTTSLSGTLFRKRSEKEEWKGGAGNTGYPSSFSLSFNGYDIEKLSGFSWNVDFMLQDTTHRTVSGVSQTDFKDEYGIAIGMGQSNDLTDDLKSNFMMEYVMFDNQWGETDKKQSYFTIGEELVYGKWSAQAALTHSVSDSVGSTASKEDLYTVSGGYKFTDNLSLKVGWQSYKTSTNTEETIRAKIAHTIYF